MENTFLNAEQVATVLGVSKPYAYKVIKTLNSQLKEKGYLTISGRVSKKYFMEKVCYNDVGKSGRDDYNGNLYRWKQQMACSISLYRLEGGEKTNTETRISY